MIYAGQSVDTTRFHRTKEEQAGVDQAKQEAAQAQNQLNQLDGAVDTQQALAAVNGGSTPI